MNNPLSPSAEAFSTFSDRQARLEERVSGLEGDLKNVLSAVRTVGETFDRRVDGIAAKIDARATPQWGVMFSGFAILIGIVGYVGNAWREPIINRQDAQASEIRSIKDNLVPRSEVTGALVTAQRDNDLIRQRIERFEARIEKRVDRLETSAYRPAWKKD